MPTYDDWKTDVGPWPDAAESEALVCRGCGRPGRRASSFARDQICWRCWADGVHVAAINLDGALPPVLTCTTCHRAAWDCTGLDKYAREEP